MPGFKIFYTNLTNITDQKWKTLLSIGSGGYMGFNMVLQCDKNLSPIFKLLQVEEQVTGNR